MLARCCYGFMVCLLLQTGNAATDPPLVAPAELLTIWKDYDLPIPPAEAQLVKFPSAFRTAGKDGKDMQPYSLGFQLEKPDQKHGSLIQVGFRKLNLDPPQARLMERIEPKVTALSGMRLAAESELMGANDLLGTAVLCEDRGWTEFARELINQALQQNAGHQYSTSYQAAQTPAKEALYLLIWQHLQAQAMQPGSDRKPIANRMKRLLDQGHTLPHKGGEWLYEAVHAAAQPGQGRPGTPLASIDRLVNAKLEMNSRKAMDDPYYQLEKFGFAAVPDLLEHMQDPRLTCTLKMGFNNFPSWPKRVGDLVCDLLQDLAGDELGASWLDRQHGEAVQKKAAIDWWQRAQRTGEEKFLLEGVVAKKNSHDSFPNACHLRILQSRYPLRLPEVFRQQMKERPKAQISTIITALTTINLPKNEFAALLKEAAQHKNAETRLSGLMALRDVDLPYFNAETIKALTSMAKDSKGPYWQSPEAALSHLAMRTDNQEVWAAFLLATKRAAIGLRMELMNPINYVYVGKQQQARKINYLASFLEDTALREMTPKNSGDEGKFSGPCAAFTISKIRVCDFAASKLAHILGFADAPDNSWTAQQWDALLQRVRRSLSK